MAFTRGAAFITVAAILFAASCKEEKQQAKPTFSAALKSLSADEYPDNPDVSIQSTLTGTFHHDKINFFRRPDSTFDITIPPSNGVSDTLLLSNIDLSEWLPMIPDRLKKDDYLEEIGLINQEWNRQQVIFNKPFFKAHGNGQEKSIVTRVDLARNCLNAGLWELIAYIKEGQDTRPYYHGWFSFPKKEYSALFEERNNVPYSKFSKYLDNWVDPESKKINLSLLRTVVSERMIPFTNLNNRFYPMLGERKKKFRNIIVPAHPTSY